MKSIEKRKGGRKFAMKTSETFCGVSGHGLLYRRLFPRLPLDMLYFTQTQTHPKSCQVTTDAEYYFQDQGLNFYLTKDEFDNEKRPVLDFCVDSPEDLNLQYWKRYIFYLANRSPRSITLTQNLPGSHSRNHRRRRYRK